MGFDLEFVIGPATKAQPGSSFDNGETAFCPASPAKFARSLNCLFSSDTTVGGIS